MKATIYYKDGERQRRINFQLADEFNENVIKRAVKREVRNRWPEIRDKIQKIKWEY